MCNAYTSWSVSLSFDVLFANDPVLLSRIMHVWRMQFELNGRYLLLWHFRQTRGQFRGSSYLYPCPYTDCPGTFNSWSKLLNHTYKSHPKQKTPRPVEVPTISVMCFCRELVTISNHLFLDLSPLFQYDINTRGSASWEALSSTSMKIFEFAGCLFSPSCWTVTGEPFAGYLMRNTPLKMFLQIKMLIPFFCALKFNWDVLLMTSWSVRLFFSIC